MPEKRTVERAKRAQREGKVPTTQAGEFVREEMHHAEEGAEAKREEPEKIEFPSGRKRGRTKH